MTVSLEDALFSAAKAGYADDLEAILGHNDVINGDFDMCVVDSLGNTALHYACQFGHPEIVSLLVGSEYIPLDIVNGLGETPLHKAAASQSRGAGDCVITLVKAGAPTDVPNNKGELPYDICVNAGRNYLAPIVDDFFIEESEEEESSEDDSDDDEDE